MALNPMDFVLPQQQVNPMGAALGGWAAGQQLNAQREEQAAKEQARQAAQQYQADVQAALRNPTAGAFAALTAQYPQQREAFKQAWDTFSKDQQDAEFLTGAQAYNAIAAGQPEAAAKVISDRIAGLKSEGKDTRKLEAIQTTLQSNPQAVQGQLGLVLSSVDPERWGKMAQEMRAAEKAPAELTEAKAKAEKAAVEAKFAESGAVLDLQKKGWDITKLQEDIKINKQNAAIAAANSAIAREGNALKRQELQDKRTELMQKRDAEVRAKTAEVESARGSMDNMLNTADRILNTPMGVVGSAAGPISSRMPTVSQDTADFEALVETLGSQAFMAQIPNIKGMGALSNAEGEKLQAALQNFSLKQSPERLLANVKEAQRLILKARQNVTNRYGVPESVPDTPAATAQGSAGKSTDEILKELGVQ